MEPKTIVAIILVAFIVDAAIWLHNRHKSDGDKKNKK